MEKIRKLIVIFSLIVCLGLCGAGGIVLSGLGSPELAENGGGNSESEEFKPADPGDIKIPETTPNASGDWNSYKASGFAGGSGTSSNPYQIATAEQLAYYCLSYTGDSYVKLTKHIDLSAHYWNTAPAQKSYCYFDGGRHTIYGLTSTSGYGLFGFIAYKVSIHDILLSVNITGTGLNHNGNICCGGLIAKNCADYYGSVYNVGIFGTINVSATYCGGIVGMNGTDYSDGNFFPIYNCFNAAKITCTDAYYCGGICGSIYSNEIRYSDSPHDAIYDCYNTGDITGKQNVGGIVGYTHHTIIYNCYNSGTIKSSQGNSYAGGIVGGDSSYDQYDEDYNFCDNGTEISYCFNDGSVYYGIIGSASNSSNCKTSNVGINSSKSTTYTGGGSCIGNNFRYTSGTGSTYFSGYRNWSIGSSSSTTWRLSSPLTLPVHNWYLACATTINLYDYVGSGGPDHIYSLYRIGVFEDQTLSKPITEITPPSRSCYKFEGYVNWDEVENDDGDGIWIYEDGYVSLSCYLSNLLVPGGNTSIYAQWSKIYYTVTLNKGSGVTSGSSYIYYWNGGWFEESECDSEIEYIPTLPEYKWYKFDGYYSASSNGTQYADANGKITRSSVSGNETWYAHWSKDASQALTITLTDHGGSGGKGEIYFWNTSYYSDSACSTSITTVAKPGKTGYVFAGYYSKSEDGTQNVDGTGKIIKTSVSSNEEWHAHWDADYNHIYITIKSKGFTDATFSASATGGSVTVTGYTDSNGTATSKTTQVTASTGDVQCMVGYSVTVSAAANGGYTLLYLGTDANWDTSKTKSTSNWTDANTSKGNKNVYAYFIQEPGNKVKYDSVKKYYYFENGEFPQAYVGDDTNKTLQSASLGTANYTISTAWGNIPVYTYNSHRYAMLTATSAQTIKTSKGTLTTAKDGKYFFEVQPIRWMVKSSDWTADYAYNSNFVGVTADILLFSSVNTSNLNYNKDFSTTTLQSTLNGIITNANLNDFAASVSYKAEYFNNTSTTLVKESATSVTGKMRVVSTSDLEAVGSWQATASDLALFMYSSKMGANSDTAGNMAYWTRNLGTYLNNGTIVTATGNTKNNHLTEFNGVRFAITFTSGGRFGI